MKEYATDSYKGLLVLQVRVTNTVAIILLIFFIRKCPLIWQAGFLVVLHALWGILALSQTPVMQVKTGQHYSIMSVTSACWYFSLY